MARISNGIDGAEWMIGEIGDGEVAVISNIGMDNEHVHFRYNGRNSRETAVIKDKVFEYPFATEQQRHDIVFWMGYFYAHLGSSLGAANV
jgi:hypothetical protein